MSKAKERLLELNTILADNVSAKGVDASKDETTTSLVHKVEQIKTAKSEQEKSVTITKNSTTKILPDEGKTLSKVTVNVNVPSESGILDYARTIDFQNTYMDTDTLEISFGAKVVDGEAYCPNLASLTGMKHLKVDFLGVCENETMTLSYKFRFDSKVLTDTVEILEIPIIEKILPNDMNRAFQYRHKLKEIRAIIDGTHCKSFSNGCFNCANLEEVRFKPNTIFVNPSLNYCPLLSNESIESTVNGLADLTGQESQTITFHADVKAKLSDEQISTITSKNWTLA